MSLTQEVRAVLTRSCRLKVTRLEVSAGLSVLAHLAVSDPVHVVEGGGAVGGGGRVHLRRETVLGSAGVVGAVLLLLPLPGDEVLPLHGGGGQAGGLAALVLRLLCQLGEVLALSLRPILVSLETTNINSENISFLKIFQV